MLSLAVAAMAQVAAAAPPPKATSTADTRIEQVELSPLYADSYMCSEHFEGQLKYVGDALGQDCMITGGITSESEGFAGVYRTNGKTNEDWYGWGADVLAPFDGIVKKIRINPVVNRPGVL